MKSAIERLMALRVSDVMQRDVVRVPARSTMAEAAGMLLQHEISGAPVVDELDRCVGVLSAIDFVKRECELAGCSPHLLKPCQHESDVGLFDKEGVEKYMTPTVQSIAIDAPLIQAAGIMNSAHLHRLPVLDSRGRPVGMITSLDIVAALSQAIEEQSQGRQHRIETAPTPR